MRTKGILICLLLAMFTTTLFSITSIQTIYAEDNEITIISSDGENVQFPAFISKLSSRVNAEMISEKSNTITAPQIDANTLRLLRKVVRLLPEVARDDQGKEVSENNINETTIFPHSEVQNIMKVWITRNTDSNQLENLFKATTDFLDVECLKDGFAYFLSNRYIYSIAGYDQEQMEYIDRYRYGYVGDKELTILDYIGLHGQPVIKDNKLDLSSKRITSLEGIDRIEGAENIVELDLRSNSIFDAKRDNRFPRTPFSKMANLKVLNLSYNRLGNELPATFLQGVNLTRLDMSGNKKISALPEGMLDHCDLESLNVTGTRLTKDSLPHNLVNQSKIKIEVDSSCMIS